MMFATSPSTVEIPRASVTHREYGALAVSIHDGLVDCKSRGLKRSAETMMSAAVTYREYGALAVSSHDGSIDCMNAEEKEMQEVVYMQWGSRRNATPPSFICPDTEEHRSTCQCTECVFFWGNERNVPMFKFLKHSYVHFFPSDICTSNVEKLPADVIYLDTYRKSSHEFTKALMNDPQLESCRDALDLAGHDWFLESGAKVFVRPDQWDSVMEATATRKLCTRDVIVAEEFADIVDEIIARTSLGPSTCFPITRIRLKTQCL